MEIIKKIVDTIIAAIMIISKKITNGLKTTHRNQKRKSGGASKLIKILGIAFVIFILIVSVIFVKKVKDNASASGVKVSSEEMSYKDFMDAVKKGDVESAVIKTDKVEFVLDNGEQHYTDNPKYERFREKLLLHDVEVTDKTESMSDRLLNLFDFLFDLVFFGLIIYGVYKFLALTGATGFKLTNDTGVNFDNICGMDELQNEVLEITKVLKHPEQYENRGIRQTKGIILEGPPGNGKTLFAKALATAANVNFIATKGADFQSAFMSVGTVKTKNLFRKALKHKPCIIFIDEFDSIGERRNYAGTGIDKENNRIITTLLNLMDGFDSEDGILVIAATNSYHSLDPALTRPGRFDLKFHIGNPDHDTIMELIDLYTRDKAVSREIDFYDLATSFEGMSCAAIETTLNVAATIALRDKKRVITLDYIEEALKKTNEEQE